MPAARNFFGRAMVSRMVMFFFMGLSLLALFKGMKNGGGNKKPRMREASGVFSRRVAMSLTLGELEALAGTGLTGLFAFLHARVAGEEASLLEHATQFRVHLNQGAGNTMAKGTGLSG
jgi:hypothetical protein